MSPVPGAGINGSYLKQETKDADNRALELKLRDIVASYASRESFDEMIEVMKRAHNDTVENGLTNPTAVVDAVVVGFVSPEEIYRVVNGGFYANHTATRIRQ